MNIEIQCLSDGYLNLNIQIRIQTQVFNEREK